MRLTVVAALLLGSMALAQDASVLDKAKQLRELLRTVSKYPVEVRHAIPVVAQHAKLPGELLDAIAEKKPGAIDEALAKYPRDVQDAAKKLATRPEILEILMSQRAITEMVGKAYKEMGPEKLKALADELRQDDAKTEASVAAWAKRLKENRLAVQQLLQATQDYVAAAAESPEAQDFGLGCAVTERNQAVVYALPAAPLTTWVLVNADVYNELADEMVEQWLRTDSHDDFDLVMGGWWSHVKQFAQPTILEPEGRPDRLRAIASLAKMLGEAYPEKRPPFPERVKFLKEKLADFPQLKPHLRATPEEMKAPLNPDERVAKPAVAAKPPQPPTPPPAKTANTTPPPKPTDRPPTSTGRKVAPPADVAQAAPTQEQKVRHAANNQNFYWFQYNTVTPGYVPYNYYGYANPYFGAYNFRRDGWPNRIGHPGGGLNRPLRGRR